MKYTEINKIKNETERKKAYRKFYEESKRETVNAFPEKRYMFDPFVGFIERK